jgi:hypothetical protein
MLLAHGLGALPLGCDTDAVEIFGVELHRRKYDLTSSAAQADPINGAARQSFTSK